MRYRLGRCTNVVHLTNDRYGTTREAHMGTVFFAWELGAGLGHVMQLAPLALGLAQRGHHVYMALRNLTTATPHLKHANLHLLPTPNPERPAGSRVIRPTTTFAQVLHNVGWG